MEIYLNNLHIPFENLQKITLSSETLLVSSLYSKYENVPESATVTFDIWKNF